jgi:hypothetical protein
LNAGPSAVDLSGFFRLPAPGFRLPRLPAPAASGLRLPACGFRLPASGFRLPGILA